MRVVSIRLDQEQLDRYYRRAKQEKLSVSEWIRKVCDEQVGGPVAETKPVGRIPADQSSEFMYASNVAFAAPASFGNSAKLLEILGKGKPKDPEGRISKIVLPDWPSIEKELAKMDADEFEYAKNKWIDRFRDEYKLDLPPEFWSRKFDRCGWLRDKAIELGA